MGEFERHPPAGEQANAEILDPRHFYAAYVFDQAADRERDVRAVIEQAQALEYPLRYWWLSSAMDLQGSPDRLIVCVHHPSHGEDAGLDLYNLLREKEVSWDDLDAAAMDEYRFLGRPVNEPGDLRTPDGNRLYPASGAEQELPDGMIALLVITTQDIRDEAESLLGRDLTQGEFSALLAQFSKTLDWMDWTFYLGAAIYLCQEAGRVGPAAEDPI
jgi:hypothetical protein